MKDEEDKSNEKVVDCDAVADSEDSDEEKEKFSKLLGFIAGKRKEYYDGKKKDGDGGGTGEKKVEE